MMNRTIQPDAHLPAPLRSSFPLVAVLLLVACDADGAPDTRGGDWEFERDTAGELHTVRTLSGSVWGAPATLIEELSIGVMDGPDELMLGFVVAMAPDREGGVYLFDSQVPALRYYDGEGRYVRRLGGEGSGPGEYRDAALGLAVRSDGRIVMWDPRNSRLNVYDPDGTPVEHWPVASGLFTSDAFTLDTLDHMYLKILTEPPERNAPWRIGLLHLDAEGAFVDTIAEPQVPDEPTTAGGAFIPTKTWAYSPHGSMVVGVSDAYRFEVRPREGPTLRVEKAHTPVALDPEERASWEARNEWTRRNRGQFMTSEIPPVPTRKPAYRTLRVGELGRIWVHRYVAGERVEPSGEAADNPDQPPPLGWREPIVFDVFEPDGSYLGEVSPPPRTTLSVFRGDTVWGIRRGDFDEQYVVRFRIQPPEVPLEGG